MDTISEILPVLEAIRTKLGNEAHVELSVRAGSYETLSASIWPSGIGGGDPAIFVRGDNLTAVIDDLIDRADTCVVDARFKRVRKLGLDILLKADGSSSVPASELLDTVTQASLNDLLPDALDEIERLTGRRILVSFDDMEDAA